MVEELCKICDLGKGDRIFTFVNKCKEIVWMGTQGNVLLGGGGWELAAAKQR